MTLLSEVIAKIKELKTIYGYDYNFLNVYGIADFRRNEFVFLAKKAVREVIKEHKDELDKHCRIQLVTLLNRAVMKLWSNPELYDKLETEVETEYWLCVSKYVNNFAIMGLGKAQKLLTYGMG